VRPYVTAADGRTAVARVTVTGVPEAAPAVLLSANFMPPKARADKKLTLTAAVTHPAPTAVSWSVASAPLDAATCQPAPECGLSPKAPDICDANTVSTTGCSGGVLQLRGGVLQPGRYIFTAAVSPRSGGGASSSATIEVVVNSAPTDGILSTAPTTGQELVSTFRLKVVGFADPDAPITYEFGYLLNAASLGESAAVANLFRPISPMGSAYSLESLLPAAAAESAVRVRDASGAAALAHMPVAVQPFAAGPPRCYPPRHRHAV